MPDIFIEKCAKGLIKVCICYRIDGNDFEAALERMKLYRDRQYTYKLAFCRVHVNTVAVEKQ